MIYFWAWLAGFLIVWPIAVIAFIKHFEDEFGEPENVDFFMGSFVGAMIAILWPLTVPIFLMAGFIRKHLRKGEDV